MRKLCLESNDDTTKLIMTGDILAIFDNRRASRYIKDTLEYTMHEKYMEIDSSNDFRKTIERIKKICEYISAELIFSGKVSDDIKNYRVEDENFSDFAEKARKIRDNDCEIRDFEKFTNVIAQNLKNRSLYELQLLSAYHLAFSQNACNFSVPGAGKTSVVYAAFAYLSSLQPSDRKYVDKLLIISPLSAFGPWELEYEECFGDKPSVKRLSGKLQVGDKREYLYSLSPSKLTLLSYNSVPTLREELIYFLKNHRVMVVLDEAHKIKNTNGGIMANGVLDIASYCSSRVVLTGTPAPNGYEDLFNLYKFIWPNKKIIPYEPYQLKDMNKSSSDIRVNSLIGYIEPFFIRVKKSDLNIPSATEHSPIIVPMGEAQRRIYEVIEKRYMGDILTTKDSYFQQALVKARLIRLMQASTNPSLLSVPLKEFAEEEGFDAETITEDSLLIKDILRYSENEVPAKFKKAKEMIEDIIERGEKVVVWAIYIKNIRDLSAYLENNGINCKMLYGATPIASGEEDEEDVETRERIISDFQESESEFKVIIANPFAVSESISLHKACHNAIYLERSFNAAHFIQSKDRIHRYGLKPDDKTNYYYLISEDSVDDVIHTRLIEKETRLREIIESMPIPLFSNVELETGDDDIKALIAEYVNRTKAL